MQVNRNRERLPIRWIDDENSNKLDLSGAGLDNMGKHARGLCSTMDISGYRMIMNAILWIL